MTTADLRLETRIAAVRRFNRFYTQRIGVLGAGLLASPLSLTEVRVLYELAHAAPSAPPSASGLASFLGIDEGYLSRILRDFVKHGWVRRERSAADARKALLSLTSRGRKMFAPLDARSHDEAGALLEKLSARNQAELAASMRTIERILGAPAAKAAPVVLRPLEPGDIGWVIHRHGVLYAREYRYDTRFEALVAGIAADFVERFDAARERCWIVDMDGEIVGSVFLVRKSATVAKLRLLLVEPSARGLGLGARLVDECIRFARSAGYRKIVLWTQSELLAARRVYERAGFKRRAAMPHRSFGRKLIAETWELAL
jgi:DNA-binding MarR family transcriptional regulator/GNAT superfamily N-acetyltransferase